MIKLYNNQKEIASKIRKFLQASDPNIRKTQLNIIPYIILGMINSESSVAGDIAKMLKDDFSLIQYDSITRHIRRLFNNKHFDPNLFYENIIKFVISNYKIKHSDNNIHIIFDHTYSHDNYTVLLFSMKIGKQGIPLLFKCFKSNKDPDAFTNQTICDCIKTIDNYFKNSNFKANIVISKSNNIDEPWIVVTNGEPNRAITRYSYRFGAIECIFKNQKSNGFYIEKISNSSLKSFTSMYSLVCFCILFLTILGCDYTKNTKCYKNIKIETHKTYRGIKRRIVSLFNVGLILFKRAFNSHVYIRIPFTMILYDI